MEMYHNTVQNDQGYIVNGATVTVTLVSSGANATIFDKNDDALSNPFTSGYDRSKGETDFKAANGIYNVQVVSGTTTTINAVALIDPTTFSTGLNDADRIKLDSIESSADVTDVANVTAAGALMDSELVSIANVKALNQSLTSGSSPNLTVANQTVDNSSLVVVDETNLQSWIDGVDGALYKARGTGVTTSYVSTAAAGGTTFDQPAVSGEISGDQGYFAVSYAGATGVTVADLSSSSTYVYIDNAGALQQQTTVPNRQDKTRKIFTMRIGVDNVAETIINFEYYNNPIGHYTNSMRDLYEYLLIQGVPFKKDQLITGRSDLGFDVSAGSLLEFGGTGDIFNPNIKSFDAVANTAYNLMSRTALVSSETNLQKFWDNAGTITALGSTTLVGHRLYRFSSGNFAMQYGQGNYANMTLAKAGILTEEYVINPDLKNATFFGWWIIESTATVTNGTTLTDFVEYTLGTQGGSSSSLSGAVIRSNNGNDFTDIAATRANLGINTALDKRYSPVFATIATMSSASPVAIDGLAVTFTVGMLVSVVDYATGNNSGLLFGSIVAGSTGTPDGGSFINLANGLQWKQNFSTNVFIKQFGIIGNGVIDDQSAWDNLISYAESNAIVIDARGGYIFLVGQISFDGATGLTILSKGSQFKFDNRYSTTSPCFRFQNMNSFIFDEIYITNTGGYETGRSRLFIADNCDNWSGDAVRVSYDNQHLPEDSGVGDLWQLEANSRAIRISACENWEVRLLKTTKADIGLRILDCAQYEIGRVVIDTYMKGGRVDGGANGKIGSWTATGETPTFENHLRQTYNDWRKDRPGNNGLLLSDDNTTTYNTLRNFSLGEFLIEDCGEHGIRVSGENDRKNIKIGEGTTRRTGASGIKFLGSDTTYTRFLTLGTLTVIDAKVNEQTVINSSTTAVNSVNYAFNNSGTITISGSFDDSTAMAWPEFFGGEILTIILSGTASNNATFTISSRDSDTQITVNETVTTESAVAGTVTFTNEGKISHGIQAYNLRNFIFEGLATIADDETYSCQDGINFHDAARGVINSCSIGGPLGSGLSIRPSNGGTFNNCEDIVVLGGTVSNAATGIEWNHEQILLNELVWNIRCLDCTTAIKIADSDGTPGTISGDCQINVISSNCTTVINTDKDVMVSISGDDATGNATSNSLKNGSTNQVRGDKLYVLKSGSWVGL
jgi:hypothetical protein